MTKPKKSSSKKKPESKSERTKPSEKPKKPTVGQRAAAKLKGKLGKADNETKERIFKMVERQLRAEDKVSKRRKHWTDEVASKRAQLKEIIEEPLDEKERSEAALLANWHDRTVTAWQDLDEARAGRDNEMKDLSGDVRALKKSIREAIANKDQVGFKFEDGEE